MWTVPHRCAALIGEVKWYYSDGEKVPNGNGRLTTVTPLIGTYALWRGKPKRHYELVNEGSLVSRWSVNKPPDYLKASLPPTPRPMLRQPT